MVEWLVSRSVCYDFLKAWEVSLPCTYRIICTLDEKKSEIQIFFFTLEEQILIFQDTRLDNGIYKWIDNESFKDTKTSMKKKMIIIISFIPERRYFISCTGYMCPYESRRYFWCNKTILLTICPIWKLGRWAPIASVLFLFPFLKKCSTFFCSCCNCKSNLKDIIRDYWLENYYLCKMNHYKVTTISLSLSLSHSLSLSISPSLYLSLSLPVSLSFCFIFLTF